MSNGILEIYSLWRHLVWKMLYNFDILFENAMKNVFKFLI